MKATIVWLNGPSRQDLLTAFPLQENEIGCNFIRRDRAVNHVVCFDQGTVKENNKNIEAGVKYYTRDAYQKPPWNVVHQWRSVDPQNSGMMALLLATHISQDPIYILGMDWGISTRSVYTYEGRQSPRKYTIGCKRQLKILSQTHKITAVNDGVPDVDIPVIGKKAFIEMFNK